MSISEIYPIMQNIGVPVIMDITHSLQQPNQEAGVSGGRPEMIETIGKAAISVGADGIFIETHPDPGSCKIRWSKYAKAFRNGKSIEKTRCIKKHNKFLLIKKLKTNIMKKLLLLITGLLVVAVINCQSLDQIIKKHSEAIHQDKLAKISNIKITGKMTAMGMEMPMVMLMKNPNKIKVTYSFSGQEMVSVFDGEKGYMINPMMGSTTPVELTGEQLKQVQNNNIFQNQVVNYFKNSQLSLVGEENVKDKPAFKLKVKLRSSPIYLFLDKGSYLLVKMTTSVEQMGNTMNVETYMSDYVTINDVVMPKKTTAMANGMEAAVIYFDKIEVNIPMDDSIFKLK